MSRIICLFYLLFLLPSPLLAQQFSGRVVGVTDGDTIKVLTNQKEVKVRLAEIDTPEKKQAFGTKAKQFTSDMVFGKEVNVQVQNIDRYGRIVGEVILPNGQSLNQELVKAGMAWWYQKYSRNPQLGKLEAEARKNKKGLWLDSSPIPPWEFRRERRSSSMNHFLHYGTFMSPFITKKMTMI